MDERTLSGKLACLRQEEILRFNCLSSCDPEQPRLHLLFLAAVVLAAVLLLRPYDTVAIEIFD